MSFAQAFKNTFIMASTRPSRFWFVCFLLSVFALLTAKAYGFDRKKSFVLSHYIMAGVYERTGDVEKALEEYKNALKFDNQNSAIHLSLASAYLKKEETQKAIEELKLAIKYDPESVEPHAILALLYFSQDKIEEAGNEYEKALEKASLLEPGNASIYKRLGALYLQQKNFTAAEMVFKALVQLDPSDHEAYFYLGNVYDELKKRDETVKQLKKVLELKPDHHQTLNYLGYLYVEENKNLDEAESLIKKALEIEPQNGAYIDSLGWLYFKKGKNKEAIRELEKAANLLEDPVIFEHLGDAYIKAKEYEKAKLSLKKALLLNSESAAVKKKLEELEKK